MPVLLSISIQSPLTEEDHELLAGVAVMTLAIANHEMGTSPGVEENTDGESPAPAKPKAKTAKPKPLGEVPCGMTEDSTGFRCVSPLGHRGRHRFRDVMGAAVHGDATTTGRLN